MTTCELCGEFPAAVFKPQVAVCRGCNREVRRREAEDNVIDNVEFCGTCATALNPRSGVCPTCVGESLRRTKVPA